MDLVLIWVQQYHSCMGTSFVTADGEHGFWMTDAVLGLWLRLLTLHLPEPSDVDSEMVRQATREIRNRWLLASKGFFGGCVPVDLEEAILTTEGKAVVTIAIQSLLNALKRQPATISKDALNLLGFEESSLVWIADFETRRLVEVAEAFLELIQGKITDTACYTSRMPGAR